MSASNITEDVQLRSGDMIVVPRNFISRIEPYVRLTEGSLSAIFLGMGL
jgi:hypothetical protein